MKPLEPVSTQVPVPVLRMLVLPLPLSAKAAARVLLPELLPARVRVRAVLLPDKIAAPERVRLPLPEASKLPPAVLIV